MRKKLILTASTALLAIVSFSIFTKASDSTPVSMNKSNKGKPYLLNVACAARFNSLTEFHRVQFSQELGEASNNVWTTKLQMLRAIQLGGEENVPKEQLEDMLTLWTDDYLSRLVNAKNPEKALLDVLPDYKICEEKSGITQEDALQYYKSETALK